MSIPTFIIPLHQRSLPWGLSSPDDKEMHMQQISKIPISIDEGIMCCLAVNRDCYHMSFEYLVSCAKIHLIF